MFVLANHVEKGLFWSYIFLRNPLRETMLVPDLLSALALLLLLVLVLALTLISDAGFTEHLPHLAHQSRFFFLLLSSVQLSLFHLHGEHKHRAFAHPF